MNEKDTHRGEPVVALVVPCDTMWCDVVRCVVLFCVVLWVSKCNMRYPYFNDSSLALPFLCVEKGILRRFLLTPVGPGLFLRHQSCAFYVLRF